MPKTRRKKQNRSPRTVFGTSNIRVVAAEAGHLEKPKNAVNPIFKDRVYTGINKGKVYPYASARQGR